MDARAAAGSVGLRYSAPGRGRAAAVGAQEEVLNFRNRGYLRRGLPALLIAGALLVVSSECLLLAGCSSETGQVQKCDQEANEVLASLTTGLAAVRKPLALPLAETGALKKALTEYRKTISENQDLLDKMHAPEPCRELLGRLGNVIDQGRDAADVSTQFADYLGQVAPLAEQAAELVATVSKLQPDARTSFGLVGLQDQARKLLASFQSVMSQAAFQEVHRMFGEFLQHMSENLEKASKVAPDELPERTREETTPEGETPTTTPRSRESTPADEYLDAVVEEWESVNRDISATLAGIMQSTGLNNENAEFDAAVISAQSQIQELEKKYGVAPAKKK